MNIIEKESETYIHDDQIYKVVKDFCIREKKVILCDFDDLIHFTLYSGKDEMGNKNPEYTENDLEYLQGKLTEMVLKTLNSVEKYFDILACYIFIRGKNNFRKEIYSEYKAHRSAPNPLASKLYDYIKIAHEAIESNGGEADDMIFTLSNKIDNNGIVISNDKDLKQIPGIHYNHKKDVWDYVTEKQAKYNTYRLLVCGDTADNIPGARKCGIKYFENNFNIDMTDEEYEKALFEAYLKAAKGNEEQAKIDMELNKQLVLLKNMEQI